jgi:predicted pyridoxine 5'-phosphate oxidase superfamily flavin-nucleotide-binding protein
MKSKFHSGELEVQARAGVLDTARRVAGVMRSTIPPVAQEFLKHQQMVVLSTVDANGRVWASVLTGVPGFLQALDENTLRIYAAPIPYDPLGENLNTGNEIGLLVIELSTRRRMKLKGKAELAKNNIICVHAERVYALCPKYIQAREVISRAEDADNRHDKHLTSELNEKQRTWVEQTDTFFIASFHPGTGADASHRGGYPGFVRVVNAGKIVFPDYSGNNMFNTLGNITANPNAGLLFVDFENGSTLQVTGRASVIWDQDRIEEFAGAERLVEFEIEQVIEIANAVPLRWEFLGYSPFNPGKRKD